MMIYEMKDPRKDKCKAVGNRFNRWSKDCNDCEDNFHCWRYSGWKLGFIEDPEPKTSE